MNHDEAELDRMEQEGLIDPEDYIHPSYGIAVKPWTYVDTQGSSKPITRQTPNGVRVAAYMDGDRCIEFRAEPNGCWSVAEAPRPSSGKDWRIVAEGRMS